MNSVKIVRMESVAHMIAKNVWTSFMTQVMHQRVLLIENMTVLIWPISILVSILAAMHRK
ncbi:hypothetical protein DW757_03290 [Clostridium sp. AM29-11AC]|nr:hypothetical protein DW757_03290 [Clostridium sp. AM29-11AC]